MLTQMDLAKRSGIPQSTLSRIESDSVSPSFEQVCKIARSLGWPLLYFATGRERSGSDVRDLAVQLAHVGLRDLDTSSAPLIGEARPFEDLIATAARSGTPRIMESLPALLLMNDFVPGTLLAHARKESVVHRVGWIAELADWISGQLQVSEIRPDALERLRLIHVPAWERRKRTPKGTWDLMGKTLPPNWHPQRDHTLEKWLEDVPAITRKWRIVFATPQSAFLDRARALLGLDG